MIEIDVTADSLVAALLRISESEPVCILDSCGVGHLGSHLMIAGVRPVEVIEVSNDDAEETLQLLDAKLDGPHAGIFTLSYDLGLKLININHDSTHQTEPDAFLSLFDALIIHDYDSQRTYVTGDRSRFDEIAGMISDAALIAIDFEVEPTKTPLVTSGFTRDEYVDAVERIRDHIRAGDTYQTNLTQQIRCTLPEEITTQQTFWRLRRDHPAPFAAFINRPSSTVVSASPERFFKVEWDGAIEASPIKGTRRRGVTSDEDVELREQLLSSEKDRAENTMIVDLVRNDLGRVCEFGSVVVTKLCDLEEHPTLFHLVSTVRGQLREDASFSNILQAVFPCGSITGAPKIRTMEIIEEIEPSARGLSMGAIGIAFPDGWNFGDAKVDSKIDLSVAIRTMTIADGEVVFNVGGGIVIDSEPMREYEESLLKALALVRSIGGSFIPEP